MVFAQPSRSPKPTSGQQQTTSRYQAWSVQKFVLCGCRSEGLRFSDPGTPVTPTTWSRIVQAVEAALRRVSLSNVCNYNGTT